MRSLIYVSIILLGNMLIQLSPCFAQGRVNHLLNKVQEDSIMKNDNSQKEMKNYILLVYLPLDYGPEQAKTVREDWNRLLDKWKADNVYIKSYVYPAKGHLIIGPEKTVQEESLVSDHLRLISNMIIRAADYEEALSLARSCPVLKQGATVEVREIQPRPAQEIKPVDPAAAKENGSR